MVVALNEPNAWNFEDRIATIAREDKSSRVESSLASSLGISDRAWKREKIVEV